ENTSLEVDDGVRDVGFLTLIQAPAGQIRGIIRGTKDAAGGAVTVGFNHLEVIQNFALVPDMVAGGDHMDVQLKQFLGESGRDAETGGRVLPVGDDEVDGLVADSARQPVFDDGASGASED